MTTPRDELRAKLSRILYQHSNCVEALTSNLFHGKSDRGIFAEALGELDAKTADAILELLPQEGWREPALRTDWENAPRDRSPVLLKFKPGANVSTRNHWPIWIVARHAGLPEEGGIDYNGWGMPGIGGWIDEDFQGFLPLPPVPDTGESE